MTPTDLRIITPSELAQMFMEMSNEDIRLSVSQLNSEQLAHVITSMTEKNTSYWKGKTRAIILGLSERPKLEYAGQYLTVPQILDFLESNLLANEDNFNRLLAILVGMPNQTFIQLLSDLSEHQLQVLLQTALAEPLQHHLTVFIHEMNNQYLLMSENLNQILKDIENLPVESIGRHELIHIKNRINDISLEFNYTLEKMRNALRIAWNTHRFDLIESLNILKDKYVHTLNNFIGHPETSQGATGLYELLKERINIVFGNAYDLNDPESLSNGEPSIEALVKFSVWYLKDYWEIGLLPNIKSADDLELDSPSEKERAEYRDQLFSKVQANLEKLHLKTLWDIKKAHIYSKKALVEYIQENQALLNG